MCSTSGTYSAGTSSATGNEEPAGTTSTRHSEEGRSAATRKIDPTERILNHQLQNSKAREGHLPRVQIPPAPPS
jgi:hypothetical protein